jgi:hypothetical protein
MAILTIFQPKLSKIIRNRFPQLTKFLDLLRLTVALITSLRPFRNLFAGKVSRGTCK